MKNRFHTILLLSGALLVPPVFADALEELATNDFSLRFPSAMTKFSAAGDAAGVGGASTGSPYASSINPAAADWTVAPDLPFTVSPQFSRIQFDNNPEMRVATVTATFNAETNGSFQVSVLKLETATSRESNSIYLDGDYAQVQWGNRFLEALAIGVNINYSEFTTKANMDGFLAADGFSYTTGGKTGLLWAVSEKLLAGLVVDYSSAHSTTDYLDIECFCYVPANDTTISRDIREGRHCT